MKKRHLLLMLIFSILCIAGEGDFSQLKAQEPNQVTIDGPTCDNNGSKAPFHTYNRYSISQQIYLKDEINHSKGTINKIAFHVKDAGYDNDNNESGEGVERTIQIYMKNTNDGAFSNKVMQSFTSGELVYSGNFKYTSETWVEIELDTPFEYAGNNILLGAYDNFGSFNDYYPKFYAKFEYDYSRVLVASGRNSYNPTASISAGYYSYLPALQLTFASDGGGEDDPETPADPTAPTVVFPADDATISGTTVDLSWSYGENNTATHYQVSLGTDNENLSVITDGWVARTELETGGFATEGVFANVNLEYGKTYYWRVDVKNGEEGAPVVGTVWSFATPASAAFEFTTEGNWNEGANWNGGAVPGNGAIVVLKANATITAKDNINVADLTISEGASLTINGSLNITGKFSNTDASKLVINDGGQIFQKNAGVVKATFNMNIKKPTVWSENNIDGWQFISSPFTDASISDFVTTGDGNDYDLYKFDGKQVGAEWQNQKAIATFDTQFVPGRGYLASYEDAETATLRGTLNSGDTYSWDNLTYNNNSEDLANFHLIGNPFPFDMEWNKLAENIWHVNNGYAVVLENGNYDYRIDGTIPVGDGFFVKADGTNPSMYYDHKASVSVARRGSESNNSLNITATGNAGKDNVVVNFNGEGEGFPKLQNFNDAIATVYVQNNDVNYAIFNCNEDVQEIELCFNANQMGNYTISAQAEGKFETVTLVDRFTGIETNLLVEDYCFTAMSEENNNRFFIRLGNGQQTTDNSHFAYVSGEDLIIEAEGTVQIIDMMGRVVYSSDAACHVNRINVSEFNNAAYVVRVINENEVKVQKIIL